MNWSDVAPADVASRQYAWERRQLVLRMINLHFTTAKIGRYLGISSSRVQALASRAKERDIKARCPIIVWSDARNTIRDMIKEFG